MVIVLVVDRKVPLNVCHVDGERRGGRRLESTSEGWPVCGGSHQSLRRLPIATVTLGEHTYVPAAIPRLRHPLGFGGERSQAKPRLPSKRPLYVL